MLCERLVAPVVPTLPGFFFARIVGIGRHQRSGKQMDQAALLKSYVDCYLLEADKHRFSKEICQYPRTRKVRQVNRDDDIAVGHRTKYNWEKEREETYPLDNLFSHNYRAFRCNVVRPLGGRHRKNWIFVRYAPESWLSYLAIDVDRHSAAAETKFWRQVSDLEGSGIRGAFTTTPGRLERGEIIYGLNYNIFFDRPILLADLRMYVERLRQHLGWTEISTQLDNGEDKRTRNYRPPGQLNVQFANVNSELRQIELLTTAFDSDFLDMWAKRPITDFDLFREIVGDVQPQPVPQVQPSPYPNPIRSPIVRTKPIAPTQGVTTDDAFDRLVNVAAPIVRRHKGQNTELILESIREAFIEACDPIEHVDHTGNPARMNAFISRVGGYFIRHYDESKCKGSSRDAEDKIRFARSQAVNVPDAIKQIPGLSFQQKSQATQFMEAMQRFNGRVAVKVIYDSPSAMMTKAHWFRLLRKLKGYLHVVERHDVENHKCRQFTFTDAFAKDVTERRQAVASIVEIKKEETGIRHRGAAIPELGEQAYRDPLFDDLNQTIEGILAESGRP